MENDSMRPNIPILNVAWERFAQFDTISLERSKGHLRLRRWVAILGVLATLLAIIVDGYPETFPALGGLALKFLLILMPISSSVLAAFVNKFYGGGDWLVMRAGAEQILREIFTYRTILRRSPQRRAWLEQRVADIQRQVYKGLGGEMVLRPYKGRIPPRKNVDADGDDGIKDLSGEEYFSFRLQDQLAWHIGKVNKFQYERTRLQLGVLAAGGAGALLAALGGPLTVWVALTASIASALMGWEELRNLDTAVKNYSKVILELTILLDHWRNLEPEERTDTEFYMMVRSTEEILWSQNVEYIKAMQEALIASRDEEANLVNDVIAQARQADVAFKEGMRQDIVTLSAGQLSAVQGELRGEAREARESFAAEAGSERVQAELREVDEAVQRVRGNLRKVIKDLEAEFRDVPLHKETKKEVLNALLTRIPPSGEIKG